MFLGLPDQHTVPLVTGTDPATDPAPNPSIIKQKSKRTLISTVLLLLYDPLSLKNDVVPVFRIRIRICTKMSWIRKTGNNVCKILTFSMVDVAQIVECSPLTHSVLVFPTKFYK